MIVTRARPVISGRMSRARRVESSRVELMCEDDRMMVQCNGVVSTVRTVVVVDGRCLMPFMSRLLMAVVSCRVMVVVGGDVDGSLQSRRHTKVCAETRSYAKDCHRQFFAGLAVLLARSLSYYDSVHRFPIAVCSSTRRPTTKSSARACRSIGQSHMQQQSTTSRVEDERR